MQLRSGTVLSSSCFKMSGSEDFKTLVETLQTSINLMNEALENLKKIFEDKLNSQKIIVDNLQTRVSYLECQTKFNKHIALMQERKLDDYEQFSRKTNLRISGVEVGPTDSPKIIMDKIKKEASALGLEIPTNEYDRCHRIGRKYKSDSKTYQDALLKLGFWRTRDVIYQNRKSFSFKVSADLTSRRHDLLHFAMNQIELGDNSYIDYIFADVNCKLKVKSKNSKFYGFNSEAEFFTIVHLLRFEHFASDEHLADIAKGKEINSLKDLYY